MPVTSMTGFARHEGHDDACTWTWEAKSVNGKGRDARCRLPVGFEGLETKIRDAIAAKFRRGNFTVNLTVQWTQSVSGYRINADLLDQIVALMPEIERRMPEVGPPRIDGLLTLRGVIEPVEDRKTTDSFEGLEESLIDDLNVTLAALQKMRKEEGARLSAVIEDQVTNIGRLCGEIAKQATTQPEAIKARLLEQVQYLLDAVPALPEDRLVQEAALLMTKVDVREEIDRLNSHVESAWELIKHDGAIGRKFDFLCQEFNREANTLCSKSVDVALTRLGLDLKTVIDQLREQVQNIE
ncbi:MAG: YicC/YloC family endoribonuclease, partial [Rhodospirillales bacterium]